MGKRGQPFGERIWLDVKVTQQESSAAVSEESSNNNNNNNNNNNSNDDVPKRALFFKERDNIPDDVSAPASDAEVARSLQEADAATERAIAQDLREQHADAVQNNSAEVLYAEKLKQLSAMGFGHTELNLALLEQHGGNVLRVVDELISRL